MKEAIDRRPSAVDTSLLEEITEAVRILNENPKARALQADKGAVIHSRFSLGKEWGDVEQHTAFWLFPDGAKIEQIIDFPDLATAERGIKEIRVTTRGKKGERFFDEIAIRIPSLEYSHMPHIGLERNNEGHLIDLRIDEAVGRVSIATVKGENERWIWMVMRGRIFSLPGPRGLIERLEKAEMAIDITSPEIESIADLK